MWWDLNVRWERGGVRFWTIVFILVFVYFFNGFWYTCSLVQQVPKATTYLRWWEVGDAVNLTLLNETWRMSTLLDLHDFRFVSNHLRCDRDDILMVVFVHSAPANGDRRLAIRRTWGNERNFVHEAVRLVFLVGDVVSPQLRASLDAEDLQYGDLIQGNFMDTYRNLSYKHVMGLKWVSHFCHQAKYVLKADDDIFVDPFQMASYLKGRFGVAAPRDLMLCFMYHRPFVKRSRRSKWYVSVDEYRGSYYPPYCAGWGVVMSVDVVFNLYVESFNIPYFWVDDVLVTGILAERIGVTHVDLNDKILISTKAVTRWLNNPDIEQPYLFGLPEADVHSMYSLWNKTIQYYRSVNDVNR